MIRAVNNPVIRKFEFDPFSFCPLPFENRLKMELCFEFFLNLFCLYAVDFRGEFWVVLKFLIRAFFFDDVEVFTLGSRKTFKVGTQ